MSKYLEDSLQQDMDRILVHVKEMARYAEKALRDCIKSFVENNRKLLYAVVLRDRYIDEKEQQIDRLCLEFIVRQQPVAKPLRFAYSTIRINLEIERVGDYAESIARRLLKNKNPSPETFKESILEIAHLSLNMFHESIQAFIYQDCNLAKKTMQIEKNVDEMRSKIKNTIVKSFNAQQISYEMLDVLMSLVNKFERVSDQASNICTEIVYMCTGEYAKHQGSEAFRVLFVDDHNSYESQMAEAISQSINNPKFIFSSAGLDPAPIDHKFIDFMKSKGLDISRMVPKAIHQVPNLDHYQIIVALTKQVHQAFPQRLRKVIFLDWIIDDNIQTEDSNQTIDQTQEKIFQFLQTQIIDLIDAVTDNDIERGVV